MFTNYAIIEVEKVHGEFQVTGSKIPDDKVKETVFKNEKRRICESSQILGSVYVGRSKLDEGPRLDFQLDFLLEFFLSLSSFFF